MTAASAGTDDSGGKALYRFLQKALKQSADLRAKAIFQGLIEEEEGHLTTLRAVHDYLSETGFWFNSQQFSPRQGQRTVS